MLYPLGCGAVTHANVHFIKNDTQSSTIMVRKPDNTSKGLHVVWANTCACGHQYSVRSVHHRLRSRATLRLLPESLESPLRAEQRTCINH
jgi:hypothetical protein